MKKTVTPLTMLMLLIQSFIGLVTMPGCSPDSDSTKSKKLLQFDKAVRAAVLTEINKTTPLDGLSEEKAFSKATKDNLAYLYISFIDRYPSSKNASEAEIRLNQFRIFSSPADRRMFLSIKTLQDDYNMDIENAPCGVCNWGESVKTIRFDENSHEIYEGPLMLANLQFISGGWTWEVMDGKKGIYLLNASQFIYPASKPVLVLSDKDLPQRVLLKVNEALENHQNKITPDVAAQTAMAMSLIEAFGFKKGDVLTKENLLTLLKAKEFTEKCITQKWVNEKMKIVKPEAVIEAFTKTFSQKDLETFQRI